MNTQKTVLVTGVTSGIGAATAGLLSERGFRVFGTTRKPPGSDPAPGNIELVQLDVRDEESVRACVKTVWERAGRIDALVNNAGYVLLGALEETSMEEASRLFETNFFGVLRMTQAVLPMMREQRSGRIVNISSVAGFLPNPYMGIYAASKHALEGYSATLDHEVRQFGIRVSLVEPGFTRTDLGTHGQLAGQRLSTYASDRNLAIDAINKSITEGEDPAQVAVVVAKALLDRSPRMRYPAGRQARFLSRLRDWAPPRLLDRGLRKQFGLAPLAGHPSS